MDCRNDIAMGLAVARVPGSSSKSSGGLTVTAEAPKNVEAIQAVDLPVDAPVGMNLIMPYVAEHVFGRPMSL